MNKKNVVHIPATHPAQSVSSSARRNTEVSAQITLSDSILTGAVVEYRKAGYRFIRHMHTSIEIYRILSGECYMDIQSETIHCTEGDFIMILPDVVHSFYLNDTSDCEFQHIHYDPDMFSTVVLEDDGIVPITLLHAILFSSHFYYRLRSDTVIDGHIQKLIDLNASCESLFTAANLKYRYSFSFSADSLPDHTPSVRFSSLWILYTNRKPQKHKSKISWLLK